MDVLWAARTHPGLRRPQNEDSFCARPDLGLFLVADGMGGHAGGEVASRLAIEAIETFIAESTGPDIDTVWPFQYDAALSLDANRLRTAFRLANRRLQDEVARQFLLRGMATTASGLLIGSDGAATAAHIGDSRIYRHRDQALLKLSQDHSWVEEQVRAGVLDATAASQHPWRNVVTRAISGGDEPMLDLFPVPLQDGDRFLLCSDGLSVTVTEEALALALREESELGALADRLIDAANAAGGPDNITVLLLEVHAA